MIFEFSIFSIILLFTPTLAVVIENNNEAYSVSNYSIPTLGRITVYGKQHETYEVFCKRDNVTINDWVGLNHQIKIEWEVSNIYANHSKPLKIMYIVGEMDYTIPPIWAAIYFWLGEGSIISPGPRIKTFKIPINHGNSKGEEIIDIQLLNEWNMWLGVTCFYLRGHRTPNYPSISIFIAHIIME